MILFFSFKDWANMGCMMSRCLREVGIDSEAITTEETEFKYLEMPILCSTFQEAQSYLERADIIVLMHSHPALLTIPYDLSKKKLAVFHGGTEYRNKPEEINELFNDKVYVSIVQTANLLGLGAKNEKWVLPPVDVDFIQPVFPQNVRPIMGHFPRSPVVKGSGEINKVVQKLSSQYDFEYFYSNVRVDWHESLRRMGRCDIYICAMKPELNGRPYGGGLEITDLESAALGNITVTHFRDFNKYKEQFYDCPLRIANDPDQLYDELEMALSEDSEEMQESKEETRDWVVKNHCYKAVGEKLKEALEI